MYDSGVKVPKTTFDSEDANVDVQGRDVKFSPEVIEGLRKIPHYLRSKNF